MGHRWLIALFITTLAASVVSPSSEDFQIVAHPTVKGSKISRALLASIYQKDVEHWGDHTRILPVNQSGQAPVRQAFTRRASTGLSGRCLDSSMRPCAPTRVEFARGSCPRVRATPPNR